MLFLRLQIIFKKNTESAWGAGVCEQYFVDANICKHPKWKWMWRVCVQKLFIDRLAIERDHHHRRRRRWRPESTNAESKLKCVRAIIAVELSQHTTNNSRHTQVGLENCSRCLSSTSHVFVCGRTSSCRFQSLTNRVYLQFSFRFYGKLICKHFCNEMSMLITIIMAIIIERNA